MRQLLAAILLLALSLPADTVYLKDGRVLKDVTATFDGKDWAVKSGGMTSYYTEAQVDRVEKTGSSSEEGTPVSAPTESGVQLVQLLDGRVFRGRVLDLGERIRVRGQKIDFCVDAATVQRIFAPGTEVESIEETFDSSEQVAIFAEKKFSVRAPEGWIVDSSPARPLCDAVLSDVDRTCRVEFALLPGQADQYRQPAEEATRTIEDVIHAELKEELERVGKKPKVEVALLPGLGVKSYKATYNGRFRFNETEFAFEEWRFVASGNIYSIRAIAPEKEWASWADAIREALAGFSVLGPVSLEGHVFTDSKLGLSLDALDPQWIVTVGLSSRGALLRILFGEAYRFFEIRDLLLTPDQTVADGVKHYLAEYMKTARKFEKVGEENVSFGSSDARLIVYKDIVAKAGGMQFKTLVFKTPDGRVLAATGNHKVSGPTAKTGETCVNTMLASIQPVAFSDFETQLKTEKQARQYLLDAERALVEKSYQVAIAKADEALAAFPGYAKAMRVKGMALNQTGKRDEATQVFIQASELDPDPDLDRVLADIWRADGKDKIAKGKWSQGIRKLEKAYRTDSANKDLQKDLIKAYTDYVDALKQEEELKDAVRYVEGAYRRFKTLTGVRELLDRVYRDYAKYWDKIKDYEKAVQYSKKRCDLWKGVDEKQLNKAENDLKRYESKLNKQ